MEILTMWYVTTKFGLKVSRQPLLYSIAEMAITVLLCLCYIHLTNVLSECYTITVILNSTESRKNGQETSK